MNFTFSMKTGSFTVSRTFQCMWPLHSDTLLRLKVTLYFMKQDLENRVTPSLKHLCCCDFFKNLLNVLLHFYTCANMPGYMSYDKNS